MRKTLQDVASYLKEIMVPMTDEVYAINPTYTNVTSEENIREGIIALRAFLSRLYDVLYIQGDIFDTCKKVAHEYENRTTLSVYYPFLHNVSVLLINIGYQGVMAEDSQFLICEHTILNKNLSVNKNLECLKFLGDCGIEIEGIDLNDKKQELFNIENIKITYTNDSVMLMGLKVMAIAEKEQRTLMNQDVFLRCDYKILKKEETDVLSILKDTIKPLSEDVRDFVLKLHQYHLDNGFTCAVEVKGFHIYIKYSFKRKDVWGMNASFSNGYHINVKSTKMNEYQDTIKSLSPVLQKLIKKGYGCGRKRVEIGHCDGGCRGIPISLDDSVLDLRKDIQQWFEEELAYLQKK